jgi:hypothetical protein
LGTSGRRTAEAKTAEEVSGVNLAEIEIPVIHLHSIENEDRNNREASHLVTERKKFEEALLANSGRCLGVGIRHIALGNETRWLKIRAAIGTRREECPGRSIGDEPIAFETVG